MGMVLFYIMLGAFTLLALIACYIGILLIKRYKELQIDYLDDFIHFNENNINVNHIECINRLYHPNSGKYSINIWIKGNPNPYIKEYETREEMNDDFYNLEQQIGQQLL